MGIFTLLLIGWITNDLRKDSSIRRYVLLVVFAGCFGITLSPLLQFVSSMLSLDTNSFVSFNAILFTVFFLACAVLSSLTPIRSHSYVGAYVILMATIGTMLTWKPGSPELYPTSKASILFVLIVHTLHACYILTTTQLVVNRLETHHDMEIVQHVIRYYVTLFDMIIYCGQRLVSYGASPPSVSTSPKFQGSKSFDLSKESVAKTAVHRSKSM